MDPKRLADIKDDLADLATGPEFGTAQWCARAAAIIGAAHELVAEVERLKMERAERLER